MKTTLYSNNCSLWEKGEHDLYKQYLLSNQYKSLKLKLVYDRHILLINPFSENHYKPIIYQNRENNSSVHFKITEQHQNHLQNINTKIHQKAFIAPRKTKSHFPILTKLNHPHQLQIQITI